MDGKNVMRTFQITMTVAALLLGVSPALAATNSDEGMGAVTAALAKAASTLPPNGYVWNDPGTVDVVTVPVTVVVSLPQQRAYVYRGTSLVAATAVSTGKDGKNTPVGIYPILQKAEVHRSNLYAGAPMPYMQRLTWDGIALHAGKNPGFPDSHGCVRLPTAFAKKLFAVTDLGTTVVVTDQDVDPGQLDVELTRTDAQRANEAQLASLP